ncbi:MAG: biosynthetic-type acetolactate synthase large subunit [Candidatus Omnitrophica bacterium]|nr:biosynthetic-type acetolactate synthase large subunit [Candidatus Omnitrophota bacterium]
MKLKGAKILMECLIREGVEVIFGYPGGANLPTFDEIYEGKIKFILVRHEQGSAFMADGYARATGRPGVCMATSGPGATNLLTGIASAYSDSIPIVAITGQVRTWLIGNDAFQESDVIGLTRPITKHNFLVKDVRDLARTVREAFHIASTGRPGPVLIDLPVNVTQDETEFEWPEKVFIRGYQPTVDGHPGQIKKAADLIAKCKRPVIYTGGGVNLSGASQELTEFVRKTGFPITMTLLGLGAYPGTDPLSLGMLGMHGHASTNHAVQNCDLLIAIGARFDDRVTGKIEAFCPKAKIIHIDIDPASISKNVVVHVPIVGDVKLVLRGLNDIVQAPDVSEWWAEIREWQKKYPLWYKEDGSIKPQYLCEAIYRAAGKDAIVAADVGQHQMWLAQYYRFDYARTFLTSGGLGAMGYAFPAAIGAQAAYPNRLVIALVGDGGFQMTMNELSTVVQSKLPVKIVIMDNKCLGMVRQWQELFYKKRYSQVFLDEGSPDFVKLAESYRVTAKRVSKKDDLGPALKEMIATPGPYLLHVEVTVEENVYPMVQAGRALDDMIGSLS